MSSNSETARTKNLDSSIQKFMVNLYQVLGENEENIFFSPFSIYISLVLAYLGAKGETAEELQKYLQLPPDMKHLLIALQTRLGKLSNHPELNTATEMFIEQSYKLRASYKNDAKKYINSESQLVDFKTASDKATKIINSWVSSRTNNKINGLFPAKTLDETTRLVLVNAIHFKDAWLHPFSKGRTCKGKFFTSSDHSMEVDMMHISEEDFNYKREKTFQVLELPYKNKNFKMVIFLPNEINGLEALEKKLPELNVADILNGMKRREVDVALPKFKQEKSIDLNEALKKLGIKTMFDGNKADFTGIHELTEAPLVVSKVVHKAFIDVNEEGTEAAAATGFAMMPCCERIPVHFTVDHPFIFMIFYNRMPLFIGKKLSF